MAVAAYRRVVPGLWCSADPGETSSPFPGPHFSPPSAHLNRAVTGVTDMTIPITELLAYIGVGFSIAVTLGVTVDLIVKFLTSW